VYPDKSAFPKLAVALFGGSFCPVGTLRASAPFSLTNSMQEIRYPEWEQLYREAILELDPKKLRRPIDQAEAALLRRQNELMIVEDSAGVQLRVKL
jgi:hypothetical protein